MRTVMGAICCVSEEPGQESVFPSYGSDAISLMEGFDLDRRMSSKKRTSESTPDVFDCETPAESATVLYRSFDIAEKSDHEMFFVSIDVSQVGHGLEVDLSDMDAILIDSVNEGAVSRWNADHPELMVRPHDRIIVINGARGKASMLHTVMSSSLLLNMVVVRPRFMHVILNKLNGNGDREALGLEMAFCHECATVVICAVAHDGVVAEWNRRFPQYCVRPGDRIVQVDQFRGSAPLLKKHILCLDKLKLKVMAPVVEGNPGIRIDFQADELLVSRVFSKCPLGMGVSRKSDATGDVLSVSEVSAGSSAEYMGIKVGWIFLAIAGMSLRGLAYEKQEAMFHDLTSTLAKSRSWYF